VCAVQPFERSKELHHYPPRSVRSFADGQAAGVLDQVGHHRTCQLGGAEPAVVRQHKGVQTV
jgi:hypothetical protein